MVDRYKEALHQAQDELAQVEERRANLLKLIEALKVLADDDAYELSPPPGYEPKALTEEIKTVLNLTTVHLDAVQIRDALIQRGFKHPSTPKNLLISVHTVLGRIKDELDEIQRDGKPAYLAKARQVASSSASGIGIDLGITNAALIGSSGFQSIIESQKAVQKMVDDASARFKGAMGSGIQEKVAEMNKAMEEVARASKL